jgi:hypothetical protein
MENKEALQDELNSTENQLDNIVDEMIEKYGKFLTFHDADNNDSRSAYLISAYNTLMKRKEYLVDQINGFID